MAYFFSIYMYMFVIVSFDTIDHTIIYEREKHSDLRTTEELEKPSQ